MQIDSNHIVEKNSYKLSIIIPVYYNALNLPITYAKLKEAVLDKVDDYELILVDDGSRDNSYAVMQELKRQDSKIKLIKFTRNFGQRSAVVAGFRASTGDAVSFISADLQDPPEIILEMLEKWKEGRKVVLAVRKARNDGILQLVFTKVYYKILKSIALKDYPEGGSDCCVLDRQVVDTLNKFDEPNSTTVGQIIWCGFQTTRIYYTRRAREIGKSKWTFSKKIKLFIDAILGFSYFPVRVISVIGILDCIFSLMYVLYLISYKFIFGANVTGWRSIMVAIMFTSGVQMLSIGVLGEYLWRSFDSSRKRPLYIIDEDGTCSD